MFLQILEVKIDIKETGLGIIIIGKHQLLAGWINQLKVIETCSFIKGTKGEQGSA